MCHCCDSLGVSPRGEGTRSGGGAATRHGHLGSNLGFLCPPEARSARVHHPSRPPIHADFRPLHSRTPRQPRGLGSADVGSIPARTANRTDFHPTQCPEGHYSATLPSNGPPGSAFGEHRSRRHGGQEGWPTRAPHKEMPVAPADTRNLGCARVGQPPPAAEFEPFGGCSKGTAQM